jgi:hypothetical protein
MQLDKLGLQLLGQFKVPLKSPKSFVVQISKYLPIRCESSTTRAGVEPMQFEKYTRDHATIQHN